MGRLPERKRGDDGKTFDSITATPARRAGLDGHLLVLFDRARHVSFFVLEDRRDQELRVRGGLALGELAQEGDPGGDRLVELLLRVDARADLEEQLRHAAV